MAALSLEQAFQLALTHHRAGRLAEAESIYRQILAHQPNHADARHLLGAIALMVGRLDQALEWIRGAIGLRPEVPAYHGNLGETYRRLGRDEEALASFQRALSLAPDYVEALNNLGCTLAKLGRYEEAIDRLKRAVALQPDYADAWANLAKTCLDGARSSGGRTEAVVFARRAVELRPAFGEAWHHLGCALAEQGEWTESLAALRRSLELQPRSAEVLNNLGQTLLELAQREPGPNRPQLDEAMACFQQAAAWNPILAEAHANLGAMLSEAVEFDAALASYREALRICSDFAPAHLNYALLLLQLERYAEGWREHEWRWLCPHFARARRQFAAPPWDGTEGRNRTVLIHAEQGFGDTLQFFRYWPMVAERAGEVILECQPELVRLLAANVGPGVEVVARQGLDEAGLPAFDAHLPLLSLPLVLNRCDPRESLPGGAAYLQAEPELRNVWRVRLGARKGLRVGLVWSGNPDHRHDYRRSISLAQMASLQQTPGIEFHSLQKSASAFEGLADWSSYLTDFAETAALVAELDLVVSVDTSVAHLAGALGRPVWLLLPFIPDWRWGRGREETPWYPTMRLFRQPERGDWDSVVQRVAAELAKPAS